MIIPLTLSLSWPSSPRSSTFGISDLDALVNFKQSYLGNPEPHFSTDKNRRCFGAICRGEIRRCSFCFDSCGGSLDVDPKSFDRSLWRCFCLFIAWSTHRLGIWCLGFDLWRGFRSFYSYFRSSSHKIARNLCSWACLALNLQAGWNCAWSTWSLRPRVNALGWHNLRAFVAKQVRCSSTVLAAPCLNSW